MRLERLPLVAASRLLRSPRIHVVALGGALFLARALGRPGGWLLPSVYSGLAAAMALYVAVSRSRGFLDYAASTAPCPLTLALLAAGSGLAAAAVSVPVSLLLGSTPGPLLLLASALLGAAYFLAVLPLGTSLPLLAALYLAARPGRGPEWVLAASLAVGLLLAPAACLAGPGGLDPRRRLYPERRGAISG